MTNYSGVCTLSPVKSNISSGLTNNVVQLAVNRPTNLFTAYGQDDLLVVTRK